MGNEKVYQLHTEYTTMLNVWYRRLYRTMFGYKINILPDFSPILDILNKNSNINTEDDAIAYIRTIYTKKDYNFADSVNICSFIHIIVWSLLIPTQPMVDFVVKNYNFNLEIGLASGSIK
jgi:hypothetical protein